MPADRERSRLDSLGPPTLNLRDGLHDVGLWRPLPSTGGPQAAAPPRSPAPAPDKMARAHRSSAPRPRVKAIVVNYHGGQLTLGCVRSLLATDWPQDRFEVVVVDNGSDEDFRAEMRDRYGEVAVVRPPGNLGFGGGCNLVLRTLDEVDHVALVNSDVTVGPGWLGPLVTALESDQSLGAAMPKVLLATDFTELELRSPTTVPGRGDRRSLGVQVSGLRLGGVEVWPGAHLASGTWGAQRAGGSTSCYEWTMASAVLRAPVADDRALPTSALLRLAAGEPKRVEVSSGGRGVTVTVGRHPSWFSVPVGGRSVPVINSAGTVVLADGHGVDRGYLDRDDGQYDSPVETFGWSGAAVLLSRRYLDDIGLFDERYFMYYEDLDLAWRGRSRGWRYAYVPGSVVRHVHSASADDRSPFFRFHNERNRLLTLARHAPLRLVAEEAARHLLITASYARRDIAGALARGRRPSGWSVIPRLRGWCSFYGLLPGTLVARWRGVRGPEGAPRRGR